MKANEAPERLWIDPTNDLPKLSGHIDNDSVEYIRKHAVIEWLKDCSTYKDFNGNTCVDEDLFNTMVEDFEKYMEDKV